MADNGEKDNLLGNLISQIKGDRTLKEFSNDTGIGISMLSRYINGKSGKPTPKTLMKLTESSSNPQGMVTFEDLMVAAGYQSIGATVKMGKMREFNAEYHLDYPEDERYAVHEESAEYDAGSDANLNKTNHEEDQRESIRMDMVWRAQKEAMIKSVILTDESIEKEGWKKAGRGDLPEYLKKRRPDLAMIKEEDGGRKLWLFEIKSVYDRPERGQRDLSFTYRRIGMFCLGIFAGFPKDENRKVSIVTDNRGLYSTLCSYEDCSYDGELSAIVIDLDKLQIIEERQITR